MAIQMILPGKLRGTVRVPSSKSLAHRAVICAALADGISKLRNIDLSDDIRATMNAMKQLGAEIFIDRNVVAVNGIGGRIPTVSQPLQVDCNESGSTLRFLIPVFAALGCPTKWTGRGNLGNRPLTVFDEIFKQQGISCVRSTLSTFSLTISGKLHADTFRVRGDISSQFITGLLLAAPLLKEDTTIEITTEPESVQYIDLTIQAMQAFGIRIERDGNRRFVIPGGQSYQKAMFEVEGDYSQAAFFLAANFLGSEVQLTGLNTNSLQGDRAIESILARLQEHREDGVLLEIDGSQCPDIIPEVALAACLRKGKTCIQHIERLKIKECDRLEAIAKELKKLGADITAGSDELVISGVSQLQGGEVWSHSDHRIAMMLAIAATCCKEPVKLKDYECVSKSYPNFFSDFCKLNGKASSM